MVVCWVQQEPLLLLLTIMSIVVQGLPQIIVVLSTVKGVRTRTASPSNRIASGPAGAAFITPAI